MPIAASILWKPIDGAAGADPGLLPIFITQRALAAVHDHCAATRETCYGFLTGNVFRSPDGDPAYLVVESTIRLPGAIGDDAKAALMQGWVVAQDVVHRTGDQLVGWYRGRWSAETGLAPVEAETHTALFGQPWQLAVVVGSGDTTVGGVLHRSAGSGWAQECLPFYELVDPASFRPDGSKPTCLRWDNYRTEETALVPPAALSVPAVSAALASLPAVGRAASSVQPWAFLPDQFGGGDEGEGRWASRARVGRIARWAAYAAVGALGVAGVLRLYSAGAPPASRGSSPGSRAAVAPTSPEPVDRAADTLALAIAAFDLRAQLFASRQMQCPELARGLILVEERGGGPDPTQLRRLPTHTAGLGGSARLRRGLGSAEQHRPLRDDARGAARGTRAPPQRRPAPDPAGGARWKRGGCARAGPAGRASATGCAAGAARDLGHSRRAVAGRAGHDRRERRRGVPFPGGPAPGDLPVRGLHRLGRVAPGNAAARGGRRPRGTGRRRGTARPRGAAGRKAGVHLAAGDGAGPGG